MFHLLLVSGAAFVAAGAVLGAQARVLDAGLPLPRPALGLLAAFAAVRGASDWAEMADLRAGAASDATEWIATVHVVLLAAAFALLLGFALALLGTSSRRSPLAPAIAVSALAVWGISLAALLEAAHGAGRTVPPATVEAFTRWFLGFPASVCAGLALLGLSRALELESWVESRLVRAAGFAFFVHGASGAFEGVSDVLHAGWPATASFSEHGLDLALEIVETASAAAIAVLLSEAFVFQTSQRLRREETHLRDDFIALVAHELGNPLAALELATERLERARRAERTVDPRLSSDVKACTATLRRIVTDLLDTSRIHALELAIAPASVDLRPVLDRAAEVASTHDPARPAVAVTCPPELPLVLADPARLDQVLGNLLTNAAKYASPGSAVLVAAERAQGRVVVRVVNEGPAIEPAEAARIFSRHYRAHAAIRGTARGLGLGLYVARALIEAQGGRIWVDSRDGRTAFCFSIPEAAGVPEVRVPRGGSPPARADVHAAMS